ncbi:unnamed protein product [Phytophthora fragariaefolia]|uniref:Unnamed protein product n=1 Tax=Phytophthora fragariaefolia TaxID=1490495 RepID=A0A9W6WYV2_9STRA|nr:unnamed protein product [Phytophthora fragariaefolia]
MPKYPAGPGRFSPSQNTGSEELSGLPSHNKTNVKESLGVGGESAASAKRALAHVQKLVQLASARPNALTLREFRDALEVGSSRYLYARVNLCFKTLQESLKPEGSAAMKAVGFQLAGIAPRCSTHEVWRFVLEAVVTELGNSENTSSLAAAISVLGSVPVPLVLGFLLSPEREPMNKLRSILTHEDVEVRCSAIETLSILTLDVAIHVAGAGLFVFPFESHEARICCQQDVETMVNDCWKLIFHAVSVDEQSQSAEWTAGAAFTALAKLFARSSTLAPFFTSSREAIRSQAPMDDVSSVIYKHAFPRIRALIGAARALPMKHQPDALLWISMLLYTMMERSGARCPSVSVPYIEIDTEQTNADGTDDDEENHASTEPVRVDELVTDLLESWAFPTISRKASLAQATSMSRAIFILLSHPLQALTRMCWAAQLANHLIAQCYVANKSSGNSNVAELKHELCVMLVKTFAWLSGVNHQSLFVRTTEAIYLMDQEKDRRDLVQALMDTIASHVIANRDFQLLQGLCTMTFFRQQKGFSRLSPRTNGSEVFRALFQSLAKTSKSSSPPRCSAIEHQISQLIALRVFRGLLLLKLGGSSTTSPKAYRRSCEISENIVYYTSLLASHFQGMLAFPELALRESLEFFQQELFPTMGQIASQSARLQILWVGVRLYRNYSSHVPFEPLVRELQNETGRLFTAIWNDDDEMEGATFDNGLLGCGGTEEETPASRKRAGDANTVDALMVLGDCITVLAQYMPEMQPQFCQMCEKMIAAISASGIAPATTAQQCRVIEDVMVLLSNPATSDSLVVPDAHKEIFDPRTVFLPRQHLNESGEVKYSDFTRGHEYHEAITITGSADPVCIRISYYHPFTEKEDMIALEISCCNLTTWALNDLELQLRPLGGVSVVQCIDHSKDLTLRLLRAGETVSAGTSGGCTSLPPFGVMKAEKRFRLCRFTQAIFLVKAVLVQEPSQDGDDMGANPADEVPPTPIGLAFSNRFVLQFDTLLRLPQSEFATAAFFQHCWQRYASYPFVMPHYRVVQCSANGVLLNFVSANSSLLWRVQSSERSSDKLSPSTHTIAFTLQIAMLTQTRWGSYVAGSLTMNLDSVSAGWSGVLEVRSTRDNIRELEKWPKDTARLFGGDHVQVCNTHTTTAATAEPVTTGGSTALPAQSPALDAAAFTTADPTTFAPDVRSTTSFHKDVSIPTDRLASFSRTQQLEQVRAPEATRAPDQNWGNFLSKMRPSDRPRGAARGGGDAEGDRVYRPLLFQSTGYASSELFRDSYEMHSRLPAVSKTVPLLGDEAGATDSNQNQKQRHVFEPQIRLETLSSRAATAVLWVTYLAFLLAMLPGGLCRPDQARREPCIEVDTTRNIAQWVAYVANVSRYAGSVEIKLDVQEQVNTSTTGALLSSLVESNTFQELERVGTAWKMDRHATRAKNNLENEDSGVSEIEDEEVDQEAGYVLTYDARLYGIDHDMNPVAKDLIINERNRSTWVECRTGGPCEIVRLLEITQDVDRLNPVYAVSEMYTSVSMRTRFVSITCQSFAEAFFYAFWLSLMDQHSADFSSRKWAFATKLVFGLMLFAVDLSMTMLRMPKLFVGVEGAPPASDFRLEEIYVLLGFIRTGLILEWLVWIMVVVARAGRHLKALPYMATRFKQLSYRFLVLETLLIFIYVSVLSAVQIFYLAQAWYLVGYDAFIQDAVHTFAKMHTGHSSLGKFLFLSVYVYLVMFVHLPPLAGDSTGLLTSTAFNVDEKPRVDSYGFLTPESNLFCVETSGWLLELAYQAYFDPPGCPSPSGYGELTLERCGFELITHLRSNLTDTHAVVAWSQDDHRRLVISFRGTTSKENWKSNLRADQHVLWIKSRGLRWRRSCLEKVEDVAAKIPLLNMALPRVHRGFWIAYESVRDQLKEVTRLILDENPGVSVYITGHSMGGALAVLAAYDLAVNFSIKVNMYNFGGPRVGNPSFRQHYDRCVPTSYRVVMDGDIVPGWPKFVRKRVYAYVFLSY